MSDTIAPNLTGYCMKCKEKGAKMTSSPEGEDIGVAQSSNGAYRVYGWHDACGTKMTRILSKKKPEDLMLIEGYNKVASPPGKVEVVKSQSNGGKDVTAQKKTRKAKMVAKEEVKPKAAPVKRAKVKETPEAAMNVSFPLKVFAYYGKKGEPKQKLQATMKSMTQFVYDGVSYTSPTTAAVAATKTSVNGWKFWKFKDGEDIYLIDALRGGAKTTRAPRTPGTPKSKATSKTTKSVSADKLQRYSTEYGPVTLPTLKGDMQLPTRNTVKLCAAYYVDPKKARFGHVNVFLYLPSAKQLTHVRYNKKGDPQSASVKKLGTFDSWKEAIPAIVKLSESKGLHRVKVG